jgi:catechol 2,3-dioxygenase-like lactoylglutathione lyase family enzyme
MSHFHMHVAVTDLDRSIRFYSAVFGAEPGVVKDDYAKWALEEPRINFAISTRGARPGFDHVGIQTESEEELAALHARLDAARISATPQEDAACCYARSNKYWTMDPQGIAWEAFHTLGSIPTFDEAPDEASDQSCCVIPGLARPGCC